MSETFFLSSAASTTNPCLLLVRDKGFRLRMTRERRPGGRVRCIYIAEKEELRFAADSGPELLGLVALWESYGAHWNRQEPDVFDNIEIEECVEEDDDASCHA